MITVIYRIPNLIDMGKKKIAPIFMSGKISATLIIPIDVARKYGLNEPSNVIVEEKNDGILIRKLEI